MEKLEVDSKSGSDEEFFDCIGEFWIFAHIPIRNIPNNFKKNNFQIFVRFFPFIFKLKIIKKNVKTILTNLPK